MKKTIFIIIIMLCPLLAHTQSDSLKVAYRQVCATLKDYKFESQDVQWSHEKTKSIVLKIQNGFFILTINDESNIRPGVKTLKAPLDDIVFEVWWSGLKMKSINGIEITYNGKKELIESYTINGEELTLRKLCKELQLLQKIAAEENFKGTLDGSSAPKKNLKSLPQKSNTTKQAKKKPRNRIPAGI